ncbi:unnamed protein product [marine sediment metagenome]|uniref:Uncharacterized protein n=1 Tax=marine sediment metagenome TaxID=412755 RepID=X0VCC2_9ZZZZ
MNGTRIECPECGADMVLRKSKYGKFYGCSRWPECDATHGADGDGRPLGIPADKATRRARQQAHTAFDGLWRGSEATRSRAKAYKWLQGVLGLSPDECHIANLDREACGRVVEACREQASEAAK